MLDKTSNLADKMFKITDTEHNARFHKNVQ